MPPISSGFGNGFQLKRRFPFVMKAMSTCLNFLVIYPKRSWKNTYEQDLMSEEEVRKRNIENWRRTIPKLLKVSNFCTIML